MVVPLRHATGRRQERHGSRESHGSYSQGGSYSSRAPGYGATGTGYGSSRSSGPIKRPAVIGAPDGMGQGQGIPAARSYGTRGDRNGYGTHRSHESHPYAQETQSTSVGGRSWVKLCQLCIQIQDGSSISARVRSILSKGKSKLWTLPVFAFSQKRSSETKPTEMDEMNG